MRTFYSAVFYLLVPLILLRLLWRSIKSPDHRQRWRERFACYDACSDKKFPQGVLWFHAVSVGEAEALFPLVRQLQRQFPQAKCLITTMTPTGSARVRAVLGQTVEHVYLPYDTPGAVRRFMLCFKPVLAVIVETELWPNLFAHCGENNIPLYLINARLSEKSCGYQIIPSLIHPVLTHVKRIAAQTQEDAERFIAIGAKPDQVVTVGNIKFDIEIPEDMVKEGKRLKTNAFNDRFVWLTASTHRGEEQIFLDAYKELKLKIPELLLLVVPRHRERFAEVGRLCEKNNVAVVMRTSKKPCNLDTDVYLADTMGELKMLYAAADIAFVGGSMVPVGGHNLLEASAIGAPVLFGPYMANFKEIAQKVLTHNAAIQCHNKEALVQAILSVYSDSGYRNLLAEHGKLFVQMNRGVIGKLCEMLAEELKQHNHKISIDFDMLP
ncbi:lipid IV(A) 3-deoxy-D-manno-octulosonic acid transferase [Methyloglobulus sp.]|uniref:lipid IV(A) 3-deoxy-D-manno-octulosonic acid transferase n=1 Tax=Methyloglobulus sp. TaxID=2518622 RepID=UPI00398A36C7